MTINSGGISIHSGEIAGKGAPMFIGIGPMLMKSATELMNIATKMD
jgi:hypothetical protein